MNGVMALLSVFTVSRMQPFLPSVLLPERERERERKRRENSSLGSLGEWSREEEVEEAWRLSQVNESTSPLDVERPATKSCLIRRSLHTALRQRDIHTLNAFTLLKAASLPAPAPWHCPLHTPWHLASHSDPRPDYGSEADETAALHAPNTQHTLE
ncbi:hypothetical protein WMY93_030796 [Mugilogobius chulae]|uniref:Uncharacterized protein n=1 Tax=Mugilogobius chulae TaxID=88201 RepID=A0AAW0ML56_9GOBI